MAKKIPPDAFEFYFGLGPNRSYQAVADKYEVSKRAITALAAREGWQARMGKIEREAREKTDHRAAEALDAVREKHLGALQFVLGKAIEALRSMPLDTAMEAVRAIEMVIRQERLVRGEATDRAELDVAEIVKRESERWLVATGGDGYGRADHQAS